MRNVRWRRIGRLRQSAAACQNGVRRAAFSLEDFPGEIFISFVEINSIGLDEKRMSCYYEKMEKQRRNWVKFCPMLVELLHLSCSSFSGSDVMRFSSRHGAVLILT